MGRHSGAFELSDAMRTERVGARRAALMAERTSMAIGSDAAHPRLGSSSPEHIVAPVRNSGSAFMAVNAGADAAPGKAAIVTLEVPYSRTHVPAVKNSRMAAAMVVAAASLFGAATVVSADSTDNHALNQKSDTAALASFKVPGLQTVSPVDAATFTVKVDGSSKEISTDQPTLGDALRDAGVVLGADDKVSASLSEPVENGSTVTIVRVATKAVSEDAVDAHKSTEVEDPELAEGERVVETEGVDGSSVNTFEVTLEDGVEVSRIREMTVVKSERVAEVVRVGTKKASEQTAASADSSDNASTTSATTTATTAVPSGDAQSIALSMMASYGWGDDQFSCLVPLWQRESGWRSDAANPSSSARGIPQAMMSVHFGANWQTNPAAIEWMNSPSQQISWGLNYISSRYGNPCGAWAHSQSTGWY